MASGSIVDCLIMGWKVAELREIDSVGNCRDENRSTFFEKPSEYRSESDCLLG